jgi:hypothetical protein
MSIEAHDFWYVTGDTTDGVPHYLRAGGSAAEERYLSIVAETHQVTVYSVTVAESALTFYGLAPSLLASVAALSLAVMGEPSANGLMRSVSEGASPAGQLEVLVKDSVVTVPFWGEPGQQQVLAIGALAPTFVAAAWRGAVPGSLRLGHERRRADNDFD